jgi:hypothetical protein
LYEKYGFRPVGLRPRYYSDDGEDALIMTTEPISEPRFRARMAALREALDASPAPVDPDDRDGRAGDTSDSGTAGPSDPADAADLGRQR